MKTMHSALSAPAAFPLSSVAAFAEPRIIIGTNVNGFIGNSHLASAFNESAEIIKARGYTAIWSDAIAGEGTIISEDNAINIIKILVVPYTDASGIHKSSIIGTIMQPIDRIQIHEFITISDDIDRPMISGIDGIGSIGQNAGIEPLIHAIQIGNRSDIWNIILGGAIPTKSIQAAFETSGMTCSPAPIGFPDKSIWYAATCIRSAGR